MDISVGIDMIFIDAENEFRNVIKDFLQIDITLICCLFVFVFLTSMSSITSS